MATTTTTLSEQEVRARIQRGRPLALGLGVLGLIVWVSGLATNPKLALQGYHMAFFYWMGLSLALLGLRAALAHCARALGLAADSHLRVGRTAHRPR
jgi:drug/metabolite transporter (DMT)-like permease